MILGIDQSYTSTGYCILDNENIIKYGTINTDKELNIHDRVEIIVSNIKELLNENIDKVILEGLAFGMRGNATRDLAGLQFVLINHIRQINKNIEIISPTSLKKFATGSGKSKKKDMFDALEDQHKKLFSSTHKKTKGLYDIVDAYWLARYKHDT